MNFIKLTGYYPHDDFSSSIFGEPEETNVDKLVREAIHGTPSEDRAEEEGKDEPKDFDLFLNVGEDCGIESIEQLSEGGSQINCRYSTYCVRENTIEVLTKISEASGSADFTAKIINLINN
jgi:hypothetical protein